MGDPPNVTLQIRVPENLVNQIDHYRFQIKLQPTRSQMIRYLLEKALRLEATENHGGNK